MGSAAYIQLLLSLVKRGLKLLNLFFVSPTGLL